MLKSRSFRKFISLLICVSFSSAFAAGESKWEPQNRVPLKGSSVNVCQVLMAPLEGGEVSNSLGVPISSTFKREDVRSGINALIQEKGAEALQGAHLYVTGVGMGEEGKIKGEFNSVLDEMNLGSRQIDIKVLSIPKGEVKPLVQKALKEIFNRLIYFFPSVARDYEDPTRDEVVAGLITTALIELPNVLYLRHALPTADFLLTTAVHTLLLVTMTVYQKTLYNWLLRTPSSIEMFTKQVALAFPYVANYNIFGNFSKILGFLRNHTWQETREKFPHEVATFVSTQGFTMFLQTVFYNLVITKGVRGWVDTQTGKENSEDARTWSNFVSAPILAIDAWLLSLSAGAQHPLFTVGPLEFNVGHAGLAALIAVGSSLWLWPQLLNPTLRWYRASRSVVRKAKHKFSRNRDF